MKSPELFYQEKPLFGLDIGHSNIKVMQIEKSANNNLKITGYGVVDYPAQSIVNGVVTDYDAIANALYDLFSNRIIGAITTRRVACTIPTSRTFSRPMKLPLMEEKDITQAVHLEAEQYIPVPLANLYVDHEITKRSPDGTELLVVAAPKTIIDSHIKLLESVGLEVVALEPTMNASSRLFGIADPSHNEPSILVDYGSVAVDIAVFDQIMFVNSTIPNGSDSITSLIAKQLNINPQEAYQLKNMHGISSGEKKGEIKVAITPLLENLVREIQKIVRYYNDRLGQSGRKLVQIVTIGGGANMPGLSEYLSAQLNMPTRMLNPWNKVQFGHLNPPNEIDRSMYITVTGAAILNPKDLFA
jgi:type IV pilus assembly protein PilM